MDVKLISCIVIFCLTLLSYILNRIPMWITSMVSLGALYITGCMDAQAALSGFSNTNTVLMAGMFLVAAGFQRTSFVQKMCDRVIRLSGGSFQKAYAAYIVLAVVLTNLISSPVATFAILCPLLAALCDRTGTSRSRVMFPMMVVCVGCFGLLPFASAVAMCMGEGGYDLRSILKSGWAITILLSVVYIFYTMTVYPAF